MTEEEANGIVDYEDPKTLGYRPIFEGRLVDKGRWYVFYNSLYHKEADDTYWIVS